MRAFDIVEIEDEKIVKLYPAGTPRREVEDEMTYTRLAMDLGLEVPFVHGIVEMGGRLGISMDKVVGPNYLEWMLRTPLAWEKLARFFAYEHHEMHLHRAHELPALHEKLAARIRGAPLPDDVRSRALERLEALPMGDMVCHGNYHPLNIIVSLDGPKVMEWSDAAKGYYMADVARTCLLLELSALRAEDLGLSPSQVNMLEKLRGAYTYESLKIWGKGEEDLRQCMVPVAAARVAEDVPGERDILLGLIERSLG